MPVSTFVEIDSLSSIPILTHPRDINKWKIALIDHLVLLDCSAIIDGFDVEPFRMAHPHGNARPTLPTPSEGFAKKPPPHLANGQEVSRWYQWRSRELTAQRSILSSLSPQLRQELSNNHSAKGMWDYLLLKFAPSPERGQDLETKLSELTIPPLPTPEQMNLHLKKFAKIWEEMMDLDPSLDPDERISKFVFTLPEEGPLKELVKRFEKLDSRRQTWGMLMGMWKEAMGATRRFQGDGVDITEGEGGAGEVTDTEEAEIGTETGTTTIEAGGEA
ncbi:hypothetical protein CI109_101390 [Kwoniella shandongensis]|uniref:Uncharacterized protein n=1 Tax=Kwoniella shandongensis TaxID=1734106 RepID=A0A5M6BYJ2_9TREE|nr:uncharacterized protein CI109_005087 [Kwoniella shandongensis]KAA5526515.1 hypothetical protein CI109_005087 [Kwoniella shandongensis]